MSFPPRHLEKQLVAGFHFRQAVAAELVDQRARHFERHHVLHDDARSRHRAHVAPLVAGFLLLLGVEID